MKLKITLDIFSGRENPTFTMEGKEALRLADKIKFGAAMKANADQVERPSHLGYRGIRVEQMDKQKSKSIPAIMDLHDSFAITDKKIMQVENIEAIEDIVLKKILKTRVAKSIKDFEKIFRKELVLSRDYFRKWSDLIVIGPVIWPPLLVTPCKCGPIYEPAWWNDGGQKQFNNNCYNYACNHRTDTFAQPGRATGAMYTSLSGCNVAAGQRSAKMGAVSDCLIDTPAANNACPAQGHLVALVIWPNYDFHWYRKDVTGWWSHKPGGTQATNRDNSNNFISDPRNANRGGYTQFCTFMNVMHGHIKIN